MLSLFWIQWGCQPNSNHQLFSSCFDAELILIKNLNFSQWKTIGASASTNFFFIRLYFLGFYVCLTYYVFFVTFLLLLFLALVSCFDYHLSSMYLWKLISLLYYICTLNWVLDIAGIKVINFSFSQVFLPRLVLELQDVKSCWWQLIIFKGLGNCLR